MTIYGWDASHYDAVPDGARVVAEGFSFMTHKAGGDANDAELAAWWKALKPYRNQVLLGAYWVLYPGNAVARADAFLARLDSQCPGWRDGPFILQLDCEIWNGDTSTKPGLGDIRAACDRLKAKMPKLTPIVYASAGQYGNGLTGLEYPLWNARYPTDAVTTASGIYASIGGDSGKGWGSYSGQTPAIWQFSSSATIAGQTTCDANAYRGSLDQLTALLAQGWEDDMTLSDNDKAWISGQLKATNDRIDALTKMTPMNDEGGAPDGTTTTPIGAAALGQGIPDALGEPAGGRQTAWEVLEHIGDKLIEMDQKLDALQPPAA